MTDGVKGDATRLRPTLRGSRVAIRPGDRDDVEPLRAVLSEESVTRWWGEPESADSLGDRLRGDADGVLLVVEFDGQLAGGIQYSEEQDPMYRHAGIDIFLGHRYQGRGVGPEASASASGRTRRFHRATARQAASSTASPTSNGSAAEGLTADRPPEGLAIARNPTTPAVQVTIPATMTGSHSFFRKPLITEANIRSQGPSGSTSASGPNLRATTTKRKPITFATAPATHSGCRSRSKSSLGESARRALTCLVPCCSTTADIA